MLKVLPPQLEAVLYVFHNLTFIHILKLFLKIKLLEISMRYFDYDKINELLPVNVCVDVMRDLFANHTRDTIINPLRQKMWLPENVGVLGIMPAYIKALGVMGIKVISVFPDNYKKGLSSHQGQVLLFETENGALLATFNGDAITAIRTAAVSGLVTDLLARSDAHHLAIIGTGELAMPHLEAVMSVRKIQKVSIFSPTKQRMEAFAHAVFKKHAIQVERCENVQMAVESADIICTMTPSRTPILNSEWVKNGAHINAVGSSTHFARELDSNLVAKCKVFVDNYESAMNEAGDILIPIQEGVISEKHLLGDITGLLNNQHKGRENDSEITLFKSVGIAMEDVAAAYYIYQKSLPAH